MQVSGQNANQVKVPQPQFSSNCAYVPITAQTQDVPANIQTCRAVQTNTSDLNNSPVYQTVQPQTMTAQQIPAQTNQAVQPLRYPQGYNPVRNTVYPQYHPQAQNQSVQVPASASGVTIQIFNPSVQTPGTQAPTYNVNAPCYPSGYYTGQMGAYGKMHPDIDNNGGAINGNNGSNTETNNTSNITTTSATEEKKKIEKRKIVQLTDDYIRNLESYLNSRDKGVRLSAAKEVYARLEEDDSRADDKALTALINKMLQDPSEEIRILALTALNAGICRGDDYTVEVLQNIQKSDSGYGQDAVDASNILLKMSGKQVEKEFEVKDKPKKEEIRK